MLQHVFSLLAAVILLLSSWTPALTNFFAADGSFSNAIPMMPPDLQRFYRLKVDPAGTVSFDHAISQTPTVPVKDGAKVLWRRMRG
jgi:hypothetical protein